MGRCGVPETFIIGRYGNIAYKLVGPARPGNIEQVVEPGAGEHVTTCPPWLYQGHAPTREFFVDKHSQWQGDS